MSKRNTKTVQNDDAGEQALEVQSTAIIDAGPAPWPRNVNGGRLLKGIVSALLKFVSMTREQAVAIALWVMFAHCHHAFRISAILALVSPTKRCGKTTALSILGYMVPRALQAARVTPAAIYRAVNAHSPCLLVDEADSFLPGREDLRGILNSGHVKNSAYVVLTEKREAKRFSTWCPKVLALIGSLPDTLEDRSVVIGLRRKSQDEQLERVSMKAEKMFRELGGKAAKWAIDNAHKLVDSEPQLPPTLHDRAADNWMPLLAIAELVGGRWPAEARKAAATLSGIDPTQNMALGELLLHDIQRILQALSKARVQSHTIVKALVEMEDRPWPEVANGRPLTTPKLARMLKPFGITPALMRIDGDPCRGYERSQFNDAFARYLTA